MSAFGAWQRKFWHASERCFEHFGDCRSWDGSSVEHFGTVCWQQHLHTYFFSPCFCWSSLFQTMWHVYFLIELIAKPFRGAISLSSYLFVSRSDSIRVVSFDTTRHLWPPSVFLGGYRHAPFAEQPSNCTESRIRYLCTQPVGALENMGKLSQLALLDSWFGLVQHLWHLPESYERASSWTTSKRQAPFGSTVGWRFLQRHSSSKDRSPACAVKQKRRETSNFTTWFVNNLKNCPNLWMCGWSKLRFFAYFYPNLCGQLNPTPDAFRFGSLKLCLKLVRRPQTRTECLRVTTDGKIIFLHLWIMNFCNDFLVVDFLAIWGDNIHQHKEQLPNFSHYFSQLFFCRVPNFLEPKNLWFQLATRRWGMSQIARSRRAKC